MTVLDMIKTAFWAGRVRCTPLPSGLALVSSGSLVAQASAVALG